MSYYHVEFSLTTKLQYVIIAKFSLDHSSSTAITRETSISEMPYPQSMFRAKILKISKFFQRKFKFQQLYKSFCISLGIFVMMIW